MSNSKIWALVDCNNFFVSCERIFNPKLLGKPTAVLSNNDGCIVSRSQEAKDLKVPMGAPVFKIHDLIERHKVNLLSANFALYGDISSRVMSILERCVPDVHVYSVDEAFLDLSSIKLPFTMMVYEEHVEVNSYEELCAGLLKIIKKLVGIPVSIGLANTKTLCKLANEIAKTEKRFNAVTDLINIHDCKLNEYFKKIDVNEIWGIGYMLSKKLNANGIYTVFDFVNTDTSKIRKITSVMGQRTQWELQGVDCVVETEHAIKKSIASTRSFGKNVTLLTELSEAVSEYCAIASRKLRKDKSLAGYVTVFLKTNRFDKASYYSDSVTLKFDPASNFVGDITKIALQGLEKLYKKGLSYKKAGVILFDIIDENAIKLDLFNENIVASEIKSRISNSVDSLNQKWGKDILVTASSGFTKKWRAKSEKRSKSFTSKWGEILEVK